MLKRALGPMLVLAALGCDAPVASSPTTEGAGKRCMPTASSKEYGSAEVAAAPYEGCSALLDMHCGGGDRFALCSFPLNVERTKAARVQQADMCCYGDGK